MTQYKMISIRDISDGEMRDCMARMTEKKRTRAERMRSDARRRSTVAGELLARRMIAQKLGISPGGISFGRQERGKPYAIGLPVEFNISHSGELVLCAVSDRPVGVDIERIRPVKDRLIQRVCTEKELAFVMAEGLSPDEKQRRFFRVWTGKEAYFKYTGAGITALQSICILDEEIRGNTSYFFREDYAVSIFSDDEEIHEI